VLTKETGLLQNRGHFLNWVPRNWRVEDRGKDGRVTGELGCINNWEEE